jgi:hypothetical protein
VFAINVCALLLSLHKYTLFGCAPAFSRNELPQIMVSAPRFTTGFGFTVTTTVSTSEQLAPSPAVKTYVVVIVGEAVVLALFGLPNPVIGDQL